MQITVDNLKPFQLKASGELAQMLSTYPAPPFKKRYNPDTGQLYPFLCRLKAITGSGKTPMLALCVKSLGNAIVLWTTNRGAIISQTSVNLSAGGKYEGLLPEDTQVLEISDLSSSDWSDVITATDGLTILLSTAALFNRDGDVLNIHKDRGGTTYWDMLSGNGPEFRHRPLYIVYDEAHGGTQAQFARLTELNPQAFILASASPLPADLQDLVPGKSSAEKSDALELQTVTVRTKDVVEAGLLKTRLYLVDCNTSRLNALKEANDKWVSLSLKLKSIGEWPVMCAIVNSTIAGLEVWQNLTQNLGVDPRRIAVHLAGVDKTKEEANADIPWGLLIDTHKAKKSPEALRSEGYTHLIWNLSLREGWDEPWAYVAYLDSLGKSTIDISQKIGRFLRQPNAQPFDDGDLNSAYFYFNVPDEEFSDLLQSTQNDLENDGYEVISISGNSIRPSGSRISPIKKSVELPKLSVSFGDDPTILDEILLENIPKFDKNSLKAPGKVATRVLDLRRNMEDGTLQKEEVREHNAEILVWNYIVDRLSAIDSRVAHKSGTCFTPFVKEDSRMQQRMQFGSEAMTMINASLNSIQQRLNNEFRLEYEQDQIHSIKPFNLVSPDLVTDNELKRDYYRVRTFANALHQEYNGFNHFELKIAEALDTLGYMWCRNPSKTGYYIPIPEIGEGTNSFYPDFLLWSKKVLWAIDPKGSHLINDSIYHKLLDISDIDGLPLKIRVAFVLEGQYVLAHNDRPQRQSKSGCSLIWKERGKVICKQYDNPSSLSKQFI